MKFFNTTLIVPTGFLFFLSCSSISPFGGAPAKQVVDNEKALEFFVEGVTSESLGSPEEAIRNYKKSLTYDSVTVRAATTYHNLARLFLSGGQPELALQNAIRSVELDTTGADYRSLLARLYFENTMYKEASQEYQYLVNRFPDNPEYLYRLAIMYQMNRNVNNALEVFDQYIQRFGEDFSVRMQQLLLLDAKNERSQVVNILQSMIAADPGNFAIRRFLAREYIQSGSLDSATTALEPILEQKPDDIETLLNLSEIQYRNGNKEKSREFLLKLFTSTSIVDDDLVLAGQVFAEAGREDSVTAEFSVFMFGEMEKSRPSDWRPKWFMGIQMMIKDDFPEAVDRFEQVVSLNPSLVQGWQNLAIAYLEQQNYQKASERLSNALTLHQLDFQLNYFRGFADYQLNQDSSAIIYLEKAGIINPYQLDPKVLLASVYERMGNFGRSDSLFEAIVQLDPSNATVLNNFAYSLSERGIRLNEARKMSEQSLKAEPNNAAFLDTYGWILFKLKEYKEAEYYIKRSIETGDASAVVLEHLGDVYEAMGKMKDAILWWNKALEKQPGKGSVIEKLEQARKE